eukprot:1257421-Karenia_brevis.AAC.1
MLHACMPTYNVPVLLMMLACAGSSRTAWLGDRMMTLCVQQDKVFDDDGTLLEMKIPVGRFEDEGT